MLKWNTLTLGLLVTVAWVGAASAEPIYRWTAADGSVAFSDDLKKIPSQHRASAQSMRRGSLAGYERYTPAQTRPAAREHAVQLEERLERLRELNAEPEASPAARPRMSRTSTVLRLDNRASVTIPNDRLGSDEPIVVEERRVRDRNNISTTHVTVVRQGDDILTVVRPESAHDRADWADERELLAGAD